MDSEMGRLIIVPQYPTKMRYQEWWFREFPKQFIQHFDEVIRLGTDHEYLPPIDDSKFAPTIGAIEFELYQISRYLELELKEDDTLLLCDLSYPGLFTQVLYHKRPKKCFAICHATSLNSYDIFAQDRGTKYKVEKANSELFQKVFVASNYHAKKLGWKNIVIQPFPMPPMIGQSNSYPEIPIISVARNSIQKRSKGIEEEIRKAFRYPIFHPNCDTWEEYYQVLSNSKVMLITAKEETYGYQVVDAILNGCTPVAPNHFSYPELIPKDYLYNNIRELVTILIKSLGEELPAPRLLTEKSALNFYNTLSKIMIQ